MGIRGTHRGRHWPDDKQPRIHDAVVDALLSVPLAGASYGDVWQVARACCMVERVRVVEQQAAVLSVWGTEGGPARRKTMTWSTLNRKRGTDIVIFIVDSEAGKSEPILRT